MLPISVLQQQYMYHTIVDPLVIRFSVKNCIQVALSLPYNGFSSHDSDDFNISRRNFQVFPLSGKTGIYDSVKKKEIMCPMVPKIYGEYKTRRHAS